MQTHSESYEVWGIDGKRHTRRNLKLALTPINQIAALKVKGITFERCNEDKALEYLTAHETYLHVTAYRELFQRHANGPKKGKFVNLDFGDLLNLCELDDQVRETFGLFSRDIERAVKAKLVSEAAIRGEDGFEIVSDFVNSLSPSFQTSLKRDLTRRAISDIYTGDLIEHHRGSMPVWVLLEVVPFGSLLAFYLFCMERWNERDRKELHYALKYVKDVRNCASHGGCLINGFVPGQETTHVTTHMVTQWLNSKGIKNTKTRRSRMGNRRMQQLVTTAALYDLVAERMPNRDREIAELKTSLENRAMDYGTQNPFVSYFDFLAKVLDATLS